MSAAATAAGYLYASGRLRGRAQRDQEHEHDKPATEETKPQRPRVARAQVEPEVRVAALPAREDSRPRRVPTIQYRTRRWRPEQPNEE